jgi:hypothetical protein
VAHPYVLQAQVERAELAHERLVGEAARSERLATQLGGADERKAMLAHSEVEAVHSSWRRQLEHTVGTHAYRQSEGRVLPLERVPQCPPVALRAAEAERAVLSIVV